ncbi:type I methionyl aminopeptidase [candidate division KSB1 bacterium]|nr:type I methionyl aminopeptidase [candidate division KSB1 bacterium]
MIHIRSQREIELIRNSCRVVLAAFDLVEKLIEPGVETGFLDRQIEKFIKSKGARPAFKGYRGFPASSCISVEDEVVHGIPGEKILKDGEIVSIDIGVECEGFFGDSAKTFAVGEISPEKKRLMSITKQSLDEGVKEIKPGVRLSNISHKIQTIVEDAKLSVVRDLVGHGIGTQLHEDPQIPNFGSRDLGPRLREGMVFAIEPMVNFGGFKVKLLKDKWTVVTKDGSPSAHFEYTVAVSNNGVEILTPYN